MDKLDPRTKIVMVLAISTAAMLICNVGWLLLLLAGTLVIMLAGQISWCRIQKQLAGAVKMILFLLFLQVLAGQMELGILLCLRLLILILSGVILLTGEMRDYLLALVQWKMPYEMAYMILLAVHFFPILKEEALDVFYSMQLRGCEMQKTSIRKKLYFYKKMCIPILSGAMERVRDTSIAMEARGFCAYETRTYMRRLTLKKRDWICMTVVVFLTVGLIGCSRQTDFLEKSVSQQETQEDDAEQMQIILSLTGADSVSVSWTSAEEYEGILLYEDQQIQAERTMIREQEYYRYTAEMEALQAGKTYAYRVGEEQHLSHEKTFTFQPEKEFSCFCIGDIQYQIREEDYQSWGEFMKTAYAANPDAAFGLFVGDMVDKNADIRDWTAFFEEAAPVFSRIPMMTTAGNHETSIAPTTYLKMMALPQNSPLPEECYSFDYGDCHILSLNSCLFMKERKTQEGYAELIKQVNAWIQRDLKQNTKTWCVVLMHHPMYPLVEDDAIYQELRDNWEPLFQEGKVDLVVSGHQHAYMRTSKKNGITYLMVNSGEKQSYYLEEGTVFPEYAACVYEEGKNYIRMDVKKEQIELHAFDEKGKEIDHVSLEK